MKIEHLQFQLSPAKKITALFTVMLFIFPLCAQQDSLLCNDKTAWIPSTFSVDETHEDEGQSFWQNGGHVPENTVNESTDDFARAQIKQTGSATLRVFDSNGVEYDGGNYVGFYAASKAFLEGEGDFAAVTISTYLDGELRESFTGLDLIAEYAAGVNVPIHIGFLTTLSFDQVEIRFDTSQGVNQFDVFYAVIEGFCQGELPECNVPTTLNRPAFPAVIDYSLTGMDSASVGNMQHPERAVTLSMNDYATFNFANNIEGSIFLAVREQLTDYNPGTFIGFDIRNTSVGILNLMSHITIETYLNGVLQESSTGSDLLVAASMDSDANRYTIGVVTTLTADEVRIVIDQDLSLNLGTTRIYGATFQVICPGPDLQCNSMTRIINPDYPVLIDADHTGISGALCVACNIANAGNVIDDDTTNFASLVVTAGVLSSANLAVEDILNEYPAGTFAGYHLENSLLIGANLFSGITLRTYLNGVLQETASGTGALVSVDSDLFNNTGERLIGFTTEMPFDEVKISLANSGAFNIGSTKIYNLVIDSLCTTALSCDSTYWLVNSNFPGMIDAALTGIAGVACAGCEVSGEMSVITAAQDDYAIIDITAGIAASGSIAVVDPLNTYPQGTITGFAIQAVNGQIEANLLNSITIRTYNDGVLQESASGTDLLDVAVYYNWLPEGPDSYNIGLKATLAFDEVRITIGSLAGINNEVNVYGAFVDTRSSLGEGLECCAVLDIKLFLEGPYDDVTATMSTTLNEYHVLPGQNPDLSSNIGAQLFGIAAPAGQPYNTAPWNWSGREGDNYGDGPGDIPYDEEVTDWILVSVREDDSLATSEVWKCAGLLYSDGQVFFPEACGCAEAVEASKGYYIVIEHRNHLSVMTPKITMADNMLSFDFTQNQTWIYDIGGIEIGVGQKNVGGNYVMYHSNSEQINSRTDINASDDAQWLMDNSAIFQYRLADHDMNGDVNATDEFLWLINNSSFTLIPY